MRETFTCRAWSLLGRPAEVMLKGYRRRKQSSTTARHRAEPAIRIVRTGVSRTVLLIGEHAIKVPSFRGGMHGGWRGRLEVFARGYLANTSEYRWHDYQDWAGLVAPVRRSWLGGLVQVYPRCRPLPPGAELPVLDPDPGDRKSDNFGLLEGRVVRLDYDFG